MKQGCDQHKYTVLTKVLVDNGYSCVDSALKELSVQDLLTIATAQGVKVTHGLVASVLLFTKDDITKIERRARY